MPALILTPTERLQLELLPDALRAGWTVEETTAFHDSDAHRALRLQEVRAASPAVAALMDTAAATEGDDAVTALLAPDATEGLSERDLAELLFALGPEDLGRAIFQLLTNAKTADDLETVADLTLLRHHLLLSFQS